VDEEQPHHVVAVEHCSTVQAVRCGQRQHKCVCVCVCDCVCVCICARALWAHRTTCGW
jgi:hypothetical protein